jgi:hypothetical protein
MHYGRITVIAGLALEAWLLVAVLVASAQYMIALIAA